MRKLKNNKGFSLVELLITIAIAGALSGATYIAVGSVITFSKDSRVKDDLNGIRVALHRYQEDNLGTYPIPEPGFNSNVLCFDENGLYTDDCESAVFRQSLIDEKLLSKRYLSESKTDPRTNRGYAYGVTTDGRHYQIAGVKVDGENGPEAITTEKIGKDFYLSSLIRAYDSPNFVVSKGVHLPYNPDRDLTVTLQNVLGDVFVNGTPDKGLSGDILEAGDTVATTPGASVDLYFSDGSVSHLSGGSDLEILGSSGNEDEGKDGIFTKIRLKLTNGKIWNKVARLASKSEFNIETTTAIAGVRGTEFGVDDQDKLIVYSGEVGVCQLGNPICTNTITKSDFTDDQTAHTAIPSGDPLVYDMTDPVQKGKGGGATPTQQTYINGQHQTDLLHSGMVIRTLAAEAANEDPSDYDLYFAFNGIATEEVKYHGLEFYGGSQIQGLGNIKKDANGIPLVPLYSTNDIDPNDTAGSIDYISDSNNKQYKRYHVKLDYSSSGPFRNNDLDRSEDFSIRAYRCVDPNEAPACPDNRVYSSLSGDTVGLYQNPSIAKKTTYEDYTDPNIFPEFNLRTYISGPKQAITNVPTSYRPIVSNLSASPKPLSYSWAIMEKPDLMAVASIDNTGAFTAQTPGKYLIRLGATEGSRQGDSAYLVEVIDQSPQDACTSIGGYWNSASTCFTLQDTNITVGGTQTLALTNAIGPSAPTPTCGWSMGTPTGDALAYTASTSLDNNTGVFTAPWAEGNTTISCSNSTLAGLNPMTLSIDRGNYTLVSDFTDGLPSPRTEDADTAAGVKQGLNNGSNTIDPGIGGGLKLIPSAGMYLVYEGSGNMPSTGSLEIELKKDDLDQLNSYAYLLDAVDGNNKHMEVYKDTGGALSFGVDNLSALTFFTASELNDAFAQLTDPNIIVRIEWGGSTNLKLSLMNADGSGSPQVAPTTSGTPPALDFTATTNPSKIYVGSKEGGDVSTGSSTFGDPLQYPGFIKAIRISQ